MTNSVHLAVVREALADKALLGFHSGSEASDNLQKVSTAKIGTKPSAPTVVPPARS